MQRSTYKELLVYRAWATYDVSNEFSLSNKDSGANFNTKECQIGVHFMKRIYSTDQKKPNRERLTEHVLFPFCTRSRSRSVSVPYPFSMCSVPVLYPFRSRSVSVRYAFRSCSVSVLSVCVLGTGSEERCFRESACKNGTTVICNFTKWVNCRFMRENE